MTKRREVSDRFTHLKVKLSRGRRYAVFITAHDQFAVEAFENEAVDYLPKPVQRRRLAQAVQRLKEPSG
jgi:DNA-binding LytR/AlgR family response regulator